MGPVSEKRSRSSRLVAAVTAAFVATAGLPLIAGSQINGTIEDIDLYKRSDPNERNAFLRDSCTQWTLTATDVEHFFRNAHPISGEEHHHGYLVLPCSYYGTLVLGGKREEFEINAGSFGWLDDQRYGCIRECADLFWIFGPHIDDGI
jgi:hypothetical protein